MRIQDTIIFEETAELAEDHESRQLFYLDGTPDNCAEK